MKTGLEIQSDVYGMLKGIPWLMEGIGGKIYRQGMRPRDSKAEDLVVIFTTADAEQVQEAVITLNLYVPFIPYGDGGVLVEDIARCEELEGLLQRAVDSIAVSTEYLVRLTSAIHTQREEETKQSFVVARLSLKQLNRNKNN